MSVAGVIGMAIFAREEGELIKGFQSEKSKGTIERADVTDGGSGGRGFNGTGAGAGGMREEMAPYKDLTGKQ